MASEVPPLTEEGRALEDENLGPRTHVVTQQVVLLSRTSGERTGGPPLPLGPPWLSQMGLDRGPPPPGIATPWGRCYLDGAFLPLPDQVEEIGVASHGLQESLASEQRGGGHILVLFRVPLSTSGPGPGVSAP